MFSKTTLEAVAHKYTNLIESMNVEQKAEIWCTFNNAQWPELLPDEYKLLPEDSPQEIKRKLILRQAICIKVMHKILLDIGLKACLRVWNKERLPGNQFDDWWKSLNSK